MTTEACSYSPNIYWAPTVCQTLVWVMRLLHWSKHREMPALYNLHSSAARSSAARIWIQEVWLLGCKGIIAMSRCHEMLPLLETSENLIGHKYSSVKQLGDVCILWFIFRGCWDWALLDWNSASRALHWKERLALQLAQLGSSSGSAIYYTYAWASCWAPLSLNFLVCKRKIIIRPNLLCFVELFKWDIINKILWKCLVLYKVNYFYYFLLMGPQT